MNRLLLIVLTLIYLTSISFAGNGRAKFLTNKKLSSGFVKSHLLYLSTRDLISKELRMLGLNDTDFWSGHDQAFQADFQATDDLYETKLNRAKSQSQKEQVKNELFMKKSNKKHNYGGIKSLLKSFVIKNMSRSKGNPDLRFMEVNGTVNKDMLNSYYFKYVKKNGNAENVKLFVLTNLDTHHLSYSQLGGAVNDLKKSLSDHWIKWLNQNIKGKVTEVIPMSHAQENEYGSYLKISKDELHQQINSDFKNSLLLSVNINVTNLNTDPSEEDLFLHMSGGAFVKDLSTGKIITNYSFPSIDKEYTVAEGGILNILANEIYRMPLAKFPDIRRVASSVDSNQGVFRVKMSGYKRTNQILEFLDVMKNFGINNSLDNYLESISSSEASVLVYFAGEQSELKSTLMRLKSSSRGYSFSVLDRGEGLRIKFN